MADEYNLMHKRVLEDPGTAGDQAEELWASLLRNWLPANYPVVTKGRLINETGEASPQVDVLVLHPSYPLHLRQMKHYFMGGVIAAFECKLTLKKRDLKKIFKNAAVIKRMQEPKTGTPYDELHSLPLYGVLAHSHDWKNTSSIYDHVYDLQAAFAEHPREMLDLVCIADAVTYYLIKHVNVGPHASYPEDMWEDVEPGVATAYYIAEERKGPEFKYDYRGGILGTLIYEITRRMAYEDPSLIPFASYLSRIGPWGGIFKSGLWAKDVLSPDICSHLTEHGYDNSPFSRWAESDF